MKVLFDTYEMALTDNSVEEFVIEMSAADTPLTAGKSGSCKVVTAPAAGTPCASTTNEVAVECQTKNGSNGLVFSLSLCFLDLRN